MKKLSLILALCLLLCGCGAQETFETLGNVWDQEVSATPAKTEFDLPQEAAERTMASEQGQIWFCPGYEITTQTLPAGDVDRTVQSICGYQRDALTFLQTSNSQIKRYECVWTAAGELGDEVYRAVILDDGIFHYIITVSASADDAGSLQDSWEPLLASFSLCG